MKQSYLVRLDEAATLWGCKVNDKLDFNDHYTKYNMYRAGFYAFLVLVAMVIIFGGL